MPDWPGEGWPSRSLSAGLALASWPAMKLQFSVTAEYQQSSAQDGCQVPVITNTQTFSSFILQLHLSRKYVAFVSQWGPSYYKKYYQKMSWQTPIKIVLKVSSGTSSCFLSLYSVCWCIESQSQFSITKPNQHLWWRECHSWPSRHIQDWQKPTESSSFPYLLPGGEVNSDHILCFRCKNYSNLKTK